MIQCSVVCKMLLVVIAIEHHPGAKKNRSRTTLCWNRTIVITKWSLLPLYLLSNNKIHAILFLLSGNSEWPYTLARAWIARPGLHLGMWVLDQWLLLPVTVKTGDVLSHPWTHFRPPAWVHQLWGLDVFCRSFNYFPSFSSLSSLWLCFSPVFYHVDLQQRALPAELPSPNSASFC